MRLQSKLLRRKSPKAITISVRSHDPSGDLTEQLLVSLYADLYYLSSMPGEYDGELSRTLAGIQIWILCRRHWSLDLAVSKTSKDNNAISRIPRLKEENSRERKA